MLAHTRITPNNYAKKRIYLDMYAVFGVFLLHLGFFVLYMDFSLPIPKLDLWVLPIDKKGWNPLFYGHIARNTPKKESKKAGVDFREAVPPGQKSLPLPNYTCKP